MNERVKNLWVKAAKSGEFEQIRGQLHDGKGYCILGVLAALALSEGVCTYAPGHKFDGRENSLSFNIMKWAEIDYDHEKGELKLTKGAGKVKLVYKGRETTLADLNDSGLSFKELAKVIEKSWGEF